MHDLKRCRQRRPDLLAVLHDAVRQRIGSIANWPPRERPTPDGGVHRLAIDGNLRLRPGGACLPCGRIADRFRGRRRARSRRKVDNGWSV